jgi:hypothetical protein
MAKSLIDYGIKIIRYKEFTYLFIHREKAPIEIYFKL